MVFSYSAFGYTGHIVKVEIDIARGIPSIDIIGLASSEIKEAKDRVRVSLKNAGYHVPGHRILINLSPAGIKKAGVAFDLALAVAILHRSEQITFSQGCDSLLVLGELELSGRISPVSGVIAAVDEGKKQGIHHVLVSSQNEYEAVSIQGINVATIGHLSDLASFSDRFKTSVRAVQNSRDTTMHYTPDFSDYRGNVKLLRSTLIAVAGRHNILYYGPPGSGKSMAATRLPSLLPSLTYEESVAVTRIYSLSEYTSQNSALRIQVPFRSPHHSSTLEGVIGGGKTLRPGEISLAHCGILFLDEVTEFRARLLQALREPIEQHEIYLSRAGRTYWFPANFQLILCSNLCPCGKFGHGAKECLCSKSEIFHYWRKLGAALLDRIDVRVFANESADDSDDYCDFEKMKEECHAAIDIQRKRYRDSSYAWNARLDQEKMHVYCKMDAETELAFNAILKKKNISRRGQSSILRIARSIADIEQENKIAKRHIQEAAEQRDAKILTAILGM